MADKLDFQIDVPESQIDTSESYSDAPTPSETEASIVEPSQTEAELVVWTKGTPKVYIAPDKVVDTPGKSVFLAGSIEQGAAEQWQKRITEDLGDIECTIFNPRRRHWDSSWEQRKWNKQFREQVEWELNLLEKADVIAMYFDPNTKSPITLLELGLHAVTPKAAEKLVLCCPEGYHRLGNVEIVCERAKVPVLGSFDELVAQVRKRLKEPKVPTEPKAPTESEAKESEAKEPQEAAQ